MDNSTIYVGDEILPVIINLREVYVEVKGTDIWIPIKETSLHYILRRCPPTSLKVCDLDPNCGHLSFEP